MAQANGVTFTMLCDAGNEIAAAYGLRHGMPDDLRTIYLAFGIDMPKFNGDDSWTLPMAARLIIDPVGIVRHIFADPDYMTRPEPSETLELLREFVGAGA